MVYAGIDAGSRAIKIVLLDGASSKIIDCGTIDQGVEQDLLAKNLFEKLLKNNGITEKDVGGITATGYGRRLISFADNVITEITCHATGVLNLVPRACTIIDIGGQDSKLLRLDLNGKVQDFTMNDRCAAGTGRFLEIVANRLDIPLRKLGQAAEKSIEPAIVSSMCVVFAETEIVGLLASGKAREDIVAGVQASIASRIFSMAAGHVDKPIIFTGGVAMISGMNKALENIFDEKISLCPEPQMTGALGAAILARKKSEGNTCESAEL